MNFSTIGNLSFEQYLTGRYGTIENLISEAKSGNMEAQTLLGTAYCDGAGNFVSKNSEKAIGWLTTSVENGYVSPYITAKLGELLDRKGTPQHRRKAYEMYRRSAELGCPESQINLAEMYRCGVEGVVNEDIKEAFEWYKRAADEAPYVTDIGELDRIRAGTLKKLGNVSGSAKLKALKLLYLNYRAGDCPEGCPQPGKAVSYLNRAAELGDAEAQLLLGQIYCEGSCERIKNVEKGKRWLRKAAANGEFTAKQVSTF